MPGGYRWWYLDAVSDDAQFGLCVIAFVGSVFSPYYAVARRRGPADPVDHCAVNISLTGCARRWCMTERPRNRVQLAADSLTIGSSTLRRDGEGYRFELHERGCPIPQLVHGSVTVQPLIGASAAYQLDRAGHHRWTPLAPKARVSVELRQPPIRWHGNAYFDSNEGDCALEQDFSGWQWSRTQTREGTLVYYEPQHRREPCWPLAVMFTANGSLPLAAMPGLVALPRSAWGIARCARAADPGNTRLLQTLVDAPFYVRSLLSTGAACSASELTVHESLNLDRFSRAWVRCLLPFRTPRFAGPHCSGTSSSAAR
jgi:carotenoid 1,2-hydratase